MSERLLALNAEQAAALDLAAHFCAKLAAIEHAHIIGDAENVDTLLAGVDPIEARLCANTLKAMYDVWRVMPAAQVRGGTDDASPMDGSRPPQSVAAAGGSSRDGEQPTAPNVYPISSDWSRKVPCA